ncbi:MAG: deoxyguanosinetriphosphate triphosphohydrolase, partial [Planctomycetota bacterium]
RYLRHLQVRDLLQTTRERMHAAGVETLADVRAAQAPLVGLSPEASRKKRELQEFLFARVYRHYRVVRLVEKARRVLVRLFEAFCEQPQQLPDEYREWVDVAGVERGVGDYIAGMTDRYAQHEYRKLFRPFEPM